ncbi:MAG TPA: restriction endonuclease subunit S [Candidatus Cloacimonadota bacterium]|nr:restriction endonuclease subunit S [Candidatus Cloacimonadota bacterium]
MRFEVNPSFDQNKVFIENWSEISGKRFDPFFNKPELRKLDDKVRLKTQWRMRNLIIKMSSGSTPSKSDKDSYYTSSFQGVPFLRVTNITEYGINWDDMVFINQETHDGLLARSQVYENDLLVTITGRIASSCTAPKDFVGNINQHSVVIKTRSEVISKQIACFLNSDIGQTIAFRYTTGGTRPALDFSSIRNLPIILSEKIVNIMENAYKLKSEKEELSKDLFNRIDSILFEQLGIELLDKEKANIQNRIFETKWNQLAGQRWDPFFHRPYIASLLSLLNPVSIKLNDICDFSNELWDQKSIFQNSFSYIEIGAIDIKNGRITEISEIEIGKAPSRARMIARDGDILVSLTRPSRGAITYLITDKIMIASTGFAIIRNLKKNISKKYLYYVLRSKLSLLQMEQRSSGGNYPAITQQELGQILIPIVEKEKQDDIVKHIDMIYKETEQLNTEANEIIIHAKQEVGKIILEG